MAALMACTLPAAAQTCTFTQKAINFGSVSLMGGAAINTTGTLSMSCSGVAGRTIYICSHLGAGTGGVIAGTGAKRYMTSTTGKIDFNLYKNSAYTTIWGSSFWGLPPTAAVRSLKLGTKGTATSTLPVYGRILANQTGAPAGAYSSAFTGADAWVTYAYSATSCAQVGSARAVAVPLQVTGNVLSACKLTASPINFGTASLLQKGVDAQANISVTCSRGTPYAVKLGGGVAAATDPKARKLRTTSGSLVTYGIYQDAARAIPWGNQDGNDLKVDAATGAAQIFTAYGRVPAQAARPGTYTDTVLVEITY